MATASKYKMSAERLEAIKKELENLEVNETVRVAELIKEARSFGDLSENSEYDEAKAEQAKLYTKIAELKDLVANAALVDTVEEELSKDAVTLGSIVKVVDLEDNEEYVYTIVGSQEANPREGRISDDSPLGKGLHGHKKGQKVQVEAPVGMLSFKIVSVKND